MRSLFLQEQKRYTWEDLLGAFGHSESDRKGEADCKRILKRLKEFGIIKLVKADPRQKDLTDLANQDIEIADIEVAGDKYFYVCTFVGVIIIDKLVLKCFPKYLPSVTEPQKEFENGPEKELKQVFKVLDKYKNSHEESLHMYSDMTDTSDRVNLLGIILFLIRDYFEYGVYTNTEEVIEVNGTGEILWDKTINEAFTLISNNRPYYPEMFTRKRRNKDHDFYQRLHSCILTECSLLLREAGLLDLFDITEVDISDEQLEDFGDQDYILDRISKELKVQFNTRKQILLKTLYSYIENKESLDHQDCLSTYGTNSFNLVWEDVCKNIMGDQLKKSLSDLRSEIPDLLSEEKSKKDEREFLLQQIERPKWSSPDGSPLPDQVHTLIPDGITIKKIEESYKFIIFDAKYYNIQLDQGKELKGQPGIESITKQYLYQLAYKPFLEKHNIGEDAVWNCFLMPTPDDEIIHKGWASLDMLTKLNLNPIQVLLLPASKCYQFYLRNEQLELKSEDFNNFTIPDKLKPKKK